MYGAIIGDIAGSVFEFDSTKTKGFELFAEGCRPTDDSVMTVAVADAALNAAPADDFDENFEEFTPEE